MYKMRVIVSLVSLWFLITAGSNFAIAGQKAVLDKNGQSDWYGAYLLEAEYSDVKLATLRKGLVVDVVSKGERRIEVEVADLKTPLVIPHVQSLSTADSAIGWVSPKYLRFLPVEVSDDGSSETVEQDSSLSDSHEQAAGNTEDEETPTSMFSNLINRFRSEPDEEESASSDAAEASEVPAKTYAVLEKAGAPDWYGAYIMDSPSGGNNLATLRKGVMVEVLETTPGRCKVRVVNISDSGVIPHGGIAGEELVGWVSARFLNVMEEEPPQVVSEVSEDNDDDGNFFSDLRNRFSGFFGSDDDSQDSETDVDDGSDSSSESSGPAMGSPGDDPGSEPWRDGLPNIYYVFADLGKDGNHFSALASGRTNLGSSSRAVKNHVESMIKSDISKVGRRNVVVIRVKATSATQVTNILRDGKLPAGRVSSGKLYTEQELIGAPCNIVGFCVIAHASTDGPVVGNEGAARSQLTKSFLLSKTGSGDWSMTNRLVKGARISFFGCNTANCQYYRDHSSIAHLLAGTFADRDVVARGKKGIGNPNSSESAYALFGLNEDQVAVRLTPEKKEYTFFIPLKDYQDENSGRKWVYENITIKFSSQEEKNELMQYYQKRGLNAQIQGDSIVVAAPKIGKISRGSKKDPLLLEVVRAIDSRKNLSTWERFLKWSRIGSDTEEMERARAVMPSLLKLLNDAKLEDIIETVREENGGTLDEDDFRIWFRIYFQNYDNENDRGSIATRACLCDDHRLTRK